MSGERGGHMRYSALLIAFLALPTSAQAEKRDVLVELQCENDPVAERIGYKIREGIRNSSSMTLVNTYSESVIQYSMVCLDPDAGTKGSITRYSYAVTTTNIDGHYDYLLTHGVQSCGTRRVDECAEGQVATIDSALSRALAHIENGTFRYKPKD